MFRSKSFTLLDGEAFLMGRRNAAHIMPKAVNISQLMRPAPCARIPVRHNILG
jgi:hypothetical protein